MMRFLTILLFAFISPFVKGENTKDVIDRYTEKIVSYECLYATYNFAILDKNGGTKFAIDGEFFSQGDMFLVKTYFSDIYCNGEYKALYDKSVSEVAVVGHNKYDANISDNPFAVLKNGPYAYTYDDVAEVTDEGGIPCYKVVLRPKSESADHTSVYVVVSQADYSVKSICYISRSGDMFKADIKSISEAGRKEPSFFEFDAAKFPDVVVNDLR